MTLYGVDVKVKPVPGHPKYYEFEFGIMMVWIFGESPEDACQKALDVIECLPYEVISRQQVLCNPIDENNPLMHNCRNSALTNGLGMLLLARPTGTEDTNPNWPEESSCMNVMDARE